MFYENKWKLIDFGFAVFISTDSLEIKEKTKKEWMIGTPNYISVRVHDGLEPGKKDDMISLGYIFLEKYLGGSLPWSIIEKDSTYTDIYPLNHLLHSTNIFRRRKKERDVFFQEIVDIPILVKYMQKYY
jgi:serine/threonine protein kinase